MFSMQNFNSNKFDEIFHKNPKNHINIRLIFLVFLFIYYLFNCLINIVPKEGILSSLLDNFLPAIPLIFVMINKIVYYDNKGFAELKIDELPQADFSNLFTSKVRRLIHEPLLRLTNYANEHQIIVKEMLKNQESKIEEIEYNINGDEKTASVIFSDIKPIYRYSSIVALIVASLLSTLSIILEPDKINWYLFIISIYVLLLLILEKFAGTHGKYIFYKKINMGSAQIDINTTINKLMPYKIYKESVVQKNNENYFIVSFCTDVRKYAFLVALISLPILSYFALGFWQSLSGDTKKLIELLPPSLALIAAFFDEQEIIANTDQHNVAVRKYNSNIDEASIKLEIYSIYRSDRISNIEIVKYNNLIYAFTFFSLTRSMQFKLRKVCKK